MYFVKINQMFDAFKLNFLKGTVYNIFYLIGLSFSLSISS